MWASARDVHAEIDRKRPRRQSNNVLYGHPPVRFWREDDLRVAESLGAWSARGEASGKRLNVYLGIPYCLRTEPDRCGFCLFPSEIYKGARELTSYLGLLRAEGRLYREYVRNADVAGVYIGGGTPNLLKADQYSPLVEIVREVFPDVPEDAEITLEGIPQLFTSEKLTSMRSAGINRVSLGVQQLDERMVAASGRSQTAADVFRTLDDCKTLGLRSSVDLIYGWPRQTVRTMLQDLEALTQLGVDHLTHYELNVAGRTHFARALRHELPSVEENLELYRTARDFLRSRGYRQTTTYDWTRIDAGENGRYRFEESIRKFLDRDEEGRVCGTDMWGWGYAGISYFFGTPDQPGFALQNVRSVEELERRLGEGEFPIERAVRYQSEDLRLVWLFTSLQATRVDRELYASLWGGDLLKEETPIWDALQDLEWVRIGPDDIQLVGDGVYYTPLIQDLFSATRILELRRS